MEGAGDRQLADGQSDEIAQGVDNLGLSVNSGQLVLSGDVASREIARAARASVQQTMDGSLDVIDTFTVLASLPADNIRESTDPESSASLQAGIASAATGTVRAFCHAAGRTGPG